MGLNAPTTSLWLSGATDSLEERNAIQSYLNRLEEWVHENLMKFSKTTIMFCTCVMAISITIRGWMVNGLKVALQRRT